MNGEKAILNAAGTAAPRYTSYPTAPHFHDGVGPEDYRRWLSELPSGATVSLYAHVPYCDTLCWFCGCHTKITQRYAPISSYLKALKAEIATLAAAMPADVRLTAMHWGGGSPTLLKPADILDLAGAVDRAWGRPSAREFAIEVDPRGLEAASVTALAEAGLTRVSIGVQDFAEDVQRAINRMQSFAETARAVDLFRAAGVGSLNLDLVYGLPRQSLARLMATLEQAVRLDPDRIALFGYAHVPWMKAHQRLIADADLPGPLERHEQAESAAAFLVAAGYHRIGFDHFAKPGDAMAIAAREGRLQRNFQGYTVDAAEALIGAGASSIGRLPQGYVQNEQAIAAYARRVEAGELATVKGYALTREDRVRARIIEKLMCDMVFDPAGLDGVDAPLAAELAETGARIVAEDADGFVAPRGAGFAMTERGRPFVRLMAARFDAHLAASRARHSVAV